MSNFRKISGNTDVYAQLNKLHLTGAEREEAIYALGVGEDIANAILWVVNGFKRRVTGAAAKASLKREIAA